MHMKMFALRFVMLIVSAILQLFGYCFHYMHFETSNECRERSIPKVQVCFVPPQLLALKHFHVHILHTERVRLCTCVPSSVYCSLRDLSFAGRKLLHAASRKRPQSAAWKLLRENTLACKINQMSMRVHQ